MKDNQREFLSERYACLKIENQPGSLEGAAVCMENIEFLYKASLLQKKANKRRSEADTVEQILSMGPIGPEGLFGYIHLAYMKNRASHLYRKAMKMELQFFEHTGIDVFNHSI